MLKRSTIDYQKPPINVVKIEKFGRNKINFQQVTLQTKQQQQQHR